MADTIFLSEEYGWTASFGLFDLVLEFLLERVSDPTTREQVQAVLDHHIGVLDVRGLPPAGREEIMAAIRNDLVSSAVSSDKIVNSGSVRSAAIGHLKVLKLMADDIARSEESE